MSDFKILDFNYVFDDVSTLTATSEDSNFPVSNLRHAFRSRVWRTSGYYKIISTNKYINYKDTIAGLEKTATLTEGEYTPTTLAAEIDTQLEATGSFNYTVTYSTTTGLWTIASSNTEFQILFSTGTNAANSARSVIGFGSNDYTGATTYTGAMIAIHTEEAVVIDNLTAEPIDSVAVIFDKEEDIGLTPEATIKIQANATNVWTSPAVSVTLTIDDDFKVATNYFTSNQEYRYWRLQVVDTKNPNLYIQIPKVYLALATTLSRNPEVGFAEKVDDKSKLEITPFGNVYADLLPNIREMQFNYKVLPDADLLTLFDIYDRVGRSTPIVIVLACDDIFSNVDRYFIYGHFDTDFDSDQKVRDIFDTGIKVVEIL